MRFKFLISAALPAVLLAGCNSQQGSSASYQPGPQEMAEASDVAAAPENAERYAKNAVSPVHAVAQAPVSTFAVDVDTAAYANVRRFLTQGQMPPRDAVRAEELINYFRYDYPAPGDRGAPFSVTTDVAQTPWNSETRLLRIGLRGYDLGRAQRPPANLVFLVDVSGSMNEPDKLPLVQRALGMVADNMKPGDHVSIVVYAGAAGVVLEPTSSPAEVRAALDDLSAGGSTAGGEGIELAYAMARENFDKEGINRVILASDGDFNVGITDQSQLEQLIERNRDDGITLTVLGFGQGNLNDSMMEAIADKGNGNYAYVDGVDEARKVLDTELSSTLFTIAKDVKVQVEFNPAEVSQYRLIGYENRALTEQDFQNDKVDAGDIGAGHQVTAIYEIVPAGSKGWLPDRHFAANRRPENAGGATGDAKGELAQVRLRYKLPNGDASRLITQPVEASRLRNAPMPSGDLAFAVAVAGFAQKLRGDDLLGDWGYADVKRLAGSQWGFSQQAWWRSEFLRLVDRADAQTRTASVRRAEDRAL
ncbi:Ca-activated chloride channel family protein [Sphingomonas kyeonggiensis]|uniref:vWA domain-containing protein n=1 Tax=Sphingomonas kyeonggiensis TaxID=1268553 RepID=UPI002788CEE5|nr:VWA domain-containing protein [Sphingomonas kyeonggiensis]MDQ0252502.1 Ca-activated chloride channel family protein [Sphingomonas kyeonggiensis]